MTTNPAPLANPGSGPGELERLAELGRMAATVAHEIRNPLAGISANAELLREALAEAPEVETVDIILTEVDRLGHLVTDLLCYCKERAADCRPTDLGWLARTTCELAAADGERGGVVVSWSGQGRALADTALSRQALLNVIRNAIQASPRGGRVSVKAEPGRITVTDQGSGVPATIRATMFEPFVTGRTRGLGLGATVALRCQIRQQGNLELLHTDNTGSTFCLSWPNA